ncbi:MAG TPA: GTP 3',8-cyclase MoaA [Gammaproteobacteria bacterium]|nr:GTP 3',8-cyclase MoaA [Gammaproteobacteria bacterium]
MNSPTLIDPFQRQIEYLRISVTDQCDLRCNYCLPQGFKDFQEPDEWLKFDEIARVVEAFVALGARRFRLTGGEPLVRKNLPDLVGRLSAITDLQDLSMSSNAVRLEKLAEPLKQAGLQRINVSLDSLDAERFRDITGGGKLHKVLKGLAAAKQAGLEPVKINMVVQGGVNDGEIPEMIRFCADQGYTLRLIETMPVGSTGRSASSGYRSLEEILASLRNEFELLPDIMPGGGPARYYRLAGSDTRIGLITPISRHFCETCNRVRLGADGVLYMCLGQDHSFPLRPLLRAGAGQEELMEAIRHAITLKPERHEFTEKPEQVIRFMSQTGG